MADTGPGCALTSIALSHKLPSTGSARSSMDRSIDESDTDSTDCFPTPPGSPSSTTAQIAFRRSIDETVDRAVTTDMGATVGDLMASLGLSSPSSPSLWGNCSNSGGKGAVSRCPSAKELQQQQQQQQQQQSPPATISLAGGVVPRRPSLDRSPLSTSLTAKRALQGHSPGLLDLSSIPKFPRDGLIHGSSENATPQSWAPDPHSQATASGATPRPPPSSTDLRVRPALRSRWSTDSEGSVQPPRSSDRKVEASRERGSCDNTRSANDDRGESRAVVDEGEEAGYKGEDESEKVPTTRPTHVTRLSDSAITLHPNPFFLALTVPAEEIAPPVSIPSSPERLVQIVPPAPKLEQNGFSPLLDARSPLTGSAPAVPETSSRFTPSPSLPSYFAFRPYRPPSHLHRIRGFIFPKSASSSEDSDCVEQPASPLDDMPQHTYGSRGDRSPPSHTRGHETKASHTVVRPGQGRLTRSQGLRIKDEGAKARPRLSRDLSEMLNNYASSKTGSSLQDATVSSVIQTATALLDGTISPAATTTDPLRVRLREMPGAVTPDSSGLPPLYISSGHSSSSSEPVSPAVLVPQLSSHREEDYLSGHHHRQQQHHPQQQQDLSRSPHSYHIQHLHHQPLRTAPRHSWKHTGPRSPSSSLPRSPLHITSYPMVPNRSDPNNLFNEAFSCANASRDAGTDVADVQDSREHPVTTTSVTGLTVHAPASPCKEPTAVGPHPESLSTTNPYFAGFV